MRYDLECRNTLFSHDGRCYNGAFAKFHYYWGPWEVFEYDVPTGKHQSRLDFWRDLNDYAVSQRGRGARKEFRIVKKENHHDSHSIENG